MISLHYLALITPLRTALTKKNPANMWENLWSASIFLEKNRRDHANHREDDDRHIQPHQVPGVHLKGPVRFATCSVVSPCWFSNDFHCHDDSLRFGPGTNRRSRTSDWPCLRPQFGTVWCLNHLVCSVAAQNTSVTTAQCKTFTNGPAIAKAQVEHSWANYLGSDPKSKFDFFYSPQRELWRWNWAVAVSQFNVFEGGFRYPSQTS